MSKYGDGVSPMIELPKPDEEMAPGAIRYGLLSKLRHTEYYEGFWARCRAFYKGGVHLLENKSVMRDVFPKHVGEKDEVYNMRQQLAHYTNHSGAIVNHMLGKLASDELRVRSEPEIDTFYTEFMDDCSPPEGEKIPLSDLLSGVLLNAAQCQKSYVLVDMPRNLDTEAATLAEQEASGALDAYCSEVLAESVVDWKLDKNGEYLWALLCFKSCERESVFAPRNTVREEYWMYDRESWIKWDVKYPKDEKPKAETIITPSDSGTHTFGKVPLVRFELPDGLWIMSKLESLAREFFNKRCALSWAEFKALMPSLYEFLDSGLYPVVPGPAGEDNRATIQKRSPAHVQERRAGQGQGDRAEWIGPTDAPFTHALKSCDSIRDEMHRVVQEMALSADNSGALLRRSEGSKHQDSAALDVVLGEYGRLARKFVARLLQLVEAGRGDEPRAWVVSGLSKFVTASTDALIEEETILDTVELPSPTFKAERKKLVARSVLGDSVSEEKLAEIDKEIEAYFSFEGELVEADTREQIEAEAARIGNEEDDAPNVSNGAQAGDKKIKPQSMVISTFRGGR